MNQNLNNRNRTDNNNENRWTGWDTAGVVGAGVGILAAVAGGLYMYSRGGQAIEQPVASNRSPQVTTRDTGSSRAHNRNTRSHPEPTYQSCNSGSDSDQRSNMSDYVSDLLQRLTVESNSGRRGVPRSSVPENPHLNNLDALLHDIYLRYISLNDEDFEKYYNVVHQIFRQLHNKMKEVDPYFNKYSSTVQFAGSHPDKLRINKPDEFDIDIVIGLPLSIKNSPINPAESDILIEAKDPGFVQLKVGVQFERLPQRDGCEWFKNKAAYEWKDERNFLLRSKFVDWFKSVVDKALNKFLENGTYKFHVDGVAYIVDKKSESGPARTLYIKNRDRNFNLDVDLVPALRFPIDRWPVSTSYRSVPPACAGKEYWMVVPKPNKGGHTPQDTYRSWRVALHEQEAMLMHDNNHMKQAIRFIKKLRDAQNMSKIASYYIKTMFFWEVMEHQNDRLFWNQKPSVLFKIMLKRFHDYLVAGKIPYFWNKNNNLIGQVDRPTLNKYAAIVGNLLEILNDPSRYKEVAKYLLTDAEFKEYNEKFLRI